jgi:hypothetical protein
MSIICTSPSFGDLIAYFTNCNFTSNQIAILIAAMNRSESMYIKEVANTTIKNYMDNMNVFNIPYSFIDLYIYIEAQQFCNNFLKYPVTFSQEMCSILDRAKNEIVNDNFLYELRTKYIDVVPSKSHNGKNRYTIYNNIYPESLQHLIDNV